MDGLALLCTLHAEGPTTLRRLREAGIQSLEEIFQLDVRDLAQVLETPPTVASRFVREAKLLDERLEEQLDEAPERVVQSGPSEITAPELPPAVSQIAGEIRPVLRRERLPAPPLATHEREGREHAAGNCSMDIILRPGLLRGLSSPICERLIEQGVRSVESLLRTANLNLARRIQLSYPLLLDLAYEARRHLDEAPHPEGQREAVAEAALVHCADPGAEASGAGGPFA